MKRLSASLAKVRRKAWLARHRDALSRPLAYPRRRLLVDLSVIARHDARTGIQRVVRAIWSEMLRQPQGRYDIVPIYASRSHGYCYGVPDHALGGVRRTGKVARCGPGDKFLGLDLSAHYLPHYVEQLSAWRAAGATIHNVVYDVLPLDRPMWFTPTARSNFVKWFEAVKRSSDQLLCISDWVAEEVRPRLTDVPSPSVARIHLSGNIAGSEPSTGIPSEVAEILANVSRWPTVLMVGTVEPRKGYDVALAAFSKLWATTPDSSPNLLIVGKPGWCTQELQDAIKAHSQFGRRLHWHCDVSDEALTELYEDCSAVLVASRGEGFGLPLSEAAFHKKWVLCRDLSVFREQALPNCLYFESDSADDLADRIVGLVAHAQNGPPPPVQLADWSDCLNRLFVTLEMADPSADGVETLERTAAE